MRVFWLCLVIATSVMALEPTTTLKDGQVLQLNGIARAERLRVPMYIGALYVMEPSSKPSDLENVGVAQMQFRFLQRLSARQWTWYVKEQIAINSPEDAWKSKVQSIQAFVDLFQGTLRPGDLLTVTRIPGKGVTVTLDDVVLGALEDEAIFTLLLRTWIGPRPPSESFKDHILAYQPVEAVEREFVEMTYPENRRAVIQRWTLRAQLAKQLETSEQDSVESESASSTHEQKASAVVVAQSTKRSEVRRSKAEEASAKPKTKQKRQEKAQVEQKKPVVAVAKGIRGKEKHKTNQRAESILKERKHSQRSKIDNRGKPQPKPAPAKPKQPELTAEQRLALVEGYQENVIDRILEKKTYPYQAMKRRYKKRSALDKKQVTVVFRVTIMRNGKLKAIEKRSSSGEKILDRAAEMLIRNQQPFPAFPRLLADKEMTFEIAVPYTIR